MLKEKLNKIFQININKDNKKKTENLVFVLIILIITVIAINMIWKDDNKNENIDNINTVTKILAVENNKVVSESYSLEEKLEYILSNISGVGNVDVLITYNETEEIIPVYNKTDKKSITNEIDSSGGVRIIEESDTQQEVIYQNDEIIVQKTVSPKIEGAIITATGANDISVKTNIIQAVEAATGLATHKIQVFEKKN